MPGEHVPDGAPLLISNIRAAVVPTPRRSATMWRMSRAAACSVIWVQGQHVSSACEVRRVVAGLMWPQEDITDRLAGQPEPA
jgi:hypothetical protein